MPIPIEGYHWFRHHEDGSTFVAYAADGFWFMVAVPHPILPLALQKNADYLHPVEPPRSERLN